MRADVRDFSNQRISSSLPARYGGIIPLPGRKGLLIFLLVYNCIVNFTTLYYYITQSRLFLKKAVAMAQDT
ncbi:MAG: hypothetical protein HY578_04000 [Nitrospinae bacterium]|nr:hypothetical protein [Nitrospinota bacterium]